MKRNKHLNILAALALAAICTATPVGAVLAPSSPASAADMACRADTVLYNGRAPLLLAINGRTAYYVAPVDAASGITWNEMMNTPRICPPGWYVPSAEDFTAMSGIPADGNWVEAIMPPSPTSSRWANATGRPPRAMTRWPGRYA